MDPYHKVLAVDGFNAKVAEQLQLVQEAIVAEHKNHLSLLLAHMDLLREATFQAEVAEERSTHYVAALQTGFTQQVDDTNGQESDERHIKSEGNYSKDSEGDSENDNAPAKKVSPWLRKSNSRKLPDQVKILYAAEQTQAVQSSKSQISEFHVPHEQRNLVQRIVLSHAFEIASGVLIMANTVIIACQQQYNGFDSGYDIKLPEVTLITKPAKETWPGAETAFFFCSIAFNTLFSVELMMRIVAHGWRSIKSGWMWFDTIVVSVGVVDMIAQDALAFNPGMMRVMRLFRLVRLLQVFEAMSSFDSLFLLIKALHASRQALIWSFLLLGLVQIMVGLFLCQVLQDYIADESVERAKRAEVYTFFGTFSRTILTMFEITMANWVPSCRALVNNVNEWFMVFYLAYRCMFCFAVLKVIAAVFITETNRVLESDDELTLMKFNRERTAFRAKLIKAFQRIDKSGTGYLHWHQLDELAEDESLASMMATLGFQMHDLYKLFWLLDDGDGRIHVQEFIGKMGRIKGQSKQIDTLSLLKLGHRLDQKMAVLLGERNKRNSLEEAEEEAAAEV